MEEYTIYPFEDLGQVIAFIRFHNPARYKRIDISERDSIGNSHPERDWTPLAAKIFRELQTYRNHSFRCRTQVECFKRYYLQTPPDRLEEIAKDVSKSTRTVRRYLNDVWDFLEGQMQRAEVIPKYDD